MRAGWLSWRPLLVVAVAVLLSLPALADAASRQGKRKLTRHWQGHGFLPGYRTPAQLRRAERGQRYRYRGGWYYYGGAGFYRGRWNGGSFGPCWTQTPIGVIWNCG